MPRKPAPAAAHVGPDISPVTPDDAVRDVTVVQQHTAQLAVVDAAYGIDGVAYDRGYYIAALQERVHASGLALLEAGRILVVLHAHEADFAAIVERLGLSRRFAQRCMQAAARIGESEAKRALASRLGSSKLLELLSEDDADIEVLADGGTLAGHSLDDIERMTTRELRQALREARAEAQADQESFDELLARKDKMINKLASERRKFEKSDFRAQLEVLVPECGTAVMAAVSAVNTAIEAIEAIVQTCKDAGERVPADVSATLGAWTEQLTGAAGAASRVKVR